MNAAPSRFPLAAVTTVSASAAAVLRDAVNQLGSEIVEERVYAGKAARYAEPPADLHPEVCANLVQRFPKGLYSHQTQAIAAALRGENLCLCTPTASGKTLVFSAVVTSLLMAHPGRKALALYPAKALIHDQQLKWTAACQELGLKVALIHGGVPGHERSAILATADIVLMTPDVLHAWLLAKLDQAEMQSFLAALDAVVLDEAHVYDGVFGTNMAFLLRRLQAVSAVRQFLLSTATIGAPESFVRDLTGTECTVIGPDQDGTAAPEKTVLVCRLARRHLQRDLNRLIQALIVQGCGRFLVFVDSRKRVEELAARAQTALDDGVPLADDEGELEQLNLDIDGHLVLPYRAGYEEDDRARIQEALTRGRLAGVIATSALELGIDIGEIEAVINLGVPPTIKAFWQRAGRAGRRNPGVVLLVDEAGRLEAFGGLNQYLEREPEPAWLYLDNECLQYANALCAAEEAARCPAERYRPGALSSLPARFRTLLDNEITPTQSVPPDLYPLKQQAFGGPHLAFPLRSGVEKSYTVTCRHQPGRSLGSLNYAQVLREAYPGAIYRYLAHPFRVVQVNHAKAEVVVVRAKRGHSTMPIRQTRVFPQFGTPPLSIRRDERNAVIETRLQVSERVLGFQEKIGRNPVENRYDLGSFYAQQPLNRYIETTGVCFHFAAEDAQREALAPYVALAFCTLCGIQPRDIGAGGFHSLISPIGGEGACRGFAVFDSTFGSLRLTRQLSGCLEEVLEEARRQAWDTGATSIAQALASIAMTVSAMPPAQTGGEPMAPLPGEAEGDWIRVIAPDQPAMLYDGGTHRGDEVRVRRYIYTPQGLRYELDPPQADVKWIVSASTVRPIYGQTQLLRYNLLTGEEAGLEPAVPA